MLCTENLLQEILRFLKAQNPLHDAGMSQILFHLQSLQLWKTCIDDNAIILVQLTSVLALSNSFFKISEIVTKTNLL